MTSLTDFRLPGIRGPADVRAIPASAMPSLAAEIRKLLVDEVARTGGHLGPNLGVVELTLALHRVFDSPQDVLLFDTGHQTYVHKILTGRQDDFHNLRQSGGMSGYPSRAESVHDVVENSHASTALSYADGLAKAAALRGDHCRVVAVVGDGALTGGMCWEALNNIGAAPDRPVVIVLNDNGRSYSMTVGGLSVHLQTLRNGVTSSSANIFQALGLSYLGPIDGHDTAAVEEALRAAVDLHRPVVVHAVTVKGKGYDPAEADETDHMHAIGVLNPTSGEPRDPVPPSWTSVFAQEIVEIGTRRRDVVCLTAAMLHPTGLGAFADQFPDRVFDVGIAEQHAVTSAAGLALGGFHPVVAIYSTFLGRAFDQILMDVALHRLPVTIVADRAGVTGPDGPSHHGMWDTAILSAVPGLHLATPRDPTRLIEQLNEAMDIANGPSVIRYPKAAAGPDIPAISRTGRTDLLRADADATVLLLAVGVMAAPCLAAAETLSAHGIAVTVADPRWSTPLDPALLELAADHRLVLSVEDTTTTGALGARVAQALAATGVTTCVATFALPAHFLPHASRKEILAGHGLDASGITNTVLKRLASHHRHPLHEQGC